MLAQSFSHVWLFATTWTVIHQAPLSIGFFRVEYWSWLPFLLQGIKPESPMSTALEGGFFTTEPPERLISQNISSVSQSCLTLCNPMDWSIPGFPVHHQLQDLAQTHVHGVFDTIQPSHPLWPPSPPAFNLSQHQGLFKSVSSSHRVAKILEFQLQHQSFQWTPRTDFL